MKIGELKKLQEKAKNRHRKIEAERRRIAQMPNVISNIVSNEKKLNPDIYLMLGKSHMPVADSSQDSKDIYDKLVIAGHGKFGFYDVNNKERVGIVYSTKKNDDVISRNDTMFSSKEEMKLDLKKQISESKTKIIKKISNAQLKKRYNLWN